MTGSRNARNFKILIDLATQAMQLRQEWLQAREARPTPPAVAGGLGRSNGASDGRVQSAPLPSSSGLGGLLDELKKNEEEAAAQNPAMAAQVKAQNQQIVAQMLSNIAKLRSDAVSHIVNNIR